MLLEAIYAADYQRLLNIFFYPFAGKSISKCVIKGRITDVLFRPATTTRAPVS